MIKMEDLEVNLSGLDATGEEEKKEEVTPITSEVVDVEWEQVEQIYKATEVTAQIELQLSRAFLQFEKFKTQLMTQLRETEAFAIQEGRKLKESMNIDGAITYELKLPASRGEKAFFIRKDQ